MQRRTTFAPRRVALVLAAPLLLVAAGLASLWPAGPNARALPPAGTEAFTVTGSVTVTSRLGTETIMLAGTATITRQEPQMDGDLEVEAAELSTFDLNGASLTGPVHITQNDAAPSNGELRSLQVGSQFPASSFFDVFVVAEAPGNAGFGSPPTVTLENDAPLHMVPVNGAGDEISLSGWPPVGVTFAAQIPGGTGSLVQTFPPGTPACSSGVPLNPQLPAKVCVGAASLTITSAYGPTATPTPTPGTPTATRTPTRTRTPTNTPPPSETTTNTPTLPAATETPPPTETPPATVTDVPTPTEAASPTLSPTPSPLATATPTTTAVATDTPTDVATPAPAKPLGDVNDDGLVNAIDATLILQYAAGILESLPNYSSADVDDNSNVNAIDAQFILQFVAGVINHLPP